MKAFDYFVLACAVGLVLVLVFSFTGCATRPDPFTCVHVDGGPWRIGCQH